MSNITYLGTCCKSKQQEKRDVRLWICMPRDSLRDSQAHCDDKLIAMTRECIHASFLLSLLLSCSLPHKAYLDHNNQGNLPVRSELEANVEDHVKTNAARLLLQKDQDEGTESKSGPKKHKYVVSNETDVTQKDSKKDSKKGSVSRRKSRAERRQALINTRNEALKNSSTEADELKSQTESDIEALKSVLQDYTGVFSSDETKRKRPKLERVKVERTSADRSVKTENQLETKGKEKKGWFQNLFNQTETGEDKDSKKNESDKGNSTSIQILSDQSIEKSTDQAEAMVLAHKQAENSQEKALVNQPTNGTSSRERNPSDNALKSLIMRTSSQLADKLPKVALCFLTPGDIPLESTWRIFLESVPLSGIDGVPGWETLFNVYTHPKQDYTYPSSSLFYGTEVQNRVEVVWGQFTVMAAEIRLFETALEDPLNERFMLLSETCIPMYPGTLVWAELLSEGRSRINSCRDPDPRAHYNVAMEYRQHDDMVKMGLKRKYWRKSGQWVALIRSHIELIVKDDVVKPIFESKCYIKDGERFCVSDEHYIPTMLAYNHLENSTDCMGGVTNVWWDGPYAHPRSWQLPDITLDLISKLRKSKHAKPEDRGPCESHQAIKTAGLIFPDIVNITAVRENRRKILQEKQNCVRFPITFRKDWKNYTEFFLKKLDLAETCSLIVAKKWYKNTMQIDTEHDLQTFAQQLAVAQPYSSQWRSLLAEIGLSIEDIEAKESRLEFASKSRRRLQGERVMGLRHSEKGDHWDLAREFLREYEALDNSICPLFARKFLRDSHKVLAEMATKLGTLEQAFLVTESSQR